MTPDPSVDPADSTRSLVERIVGDVSRIAGWREDDTRRSEVRFRIERFFNVTDFQDGQVLTSAGINTWVGEVRACREEIKRLQMDLDHLRVQSNNPRPTDGFEIPAEELPAPRPAPSPPEPSTDKHRMD